MTLAETIALLSCLLLACIGVYTEVRPQTVAVGGDYTQYIRSLEGGGGGGSGPSASTQGGASNGGPSDGSGGPALGGPGMMMAARANAWAQRINDSWFGRTVQAVDRAVSDFGEGLFQGSLATSNSWATIAGQAIGESVGGELPYLSWAIAARETKASWNDWREDPTFANAGMTLWSAAALVPGKDAASGIIKTVARVSRKLGAGDEVIEAAVAVSKRADDAPDTTGAGDYLAKKAPKQVEPGTRVLDGQYVNDRGRTEPWRAHYDEYGRMVGRTDYNAGNAAQGIPDIHHHEYDWTRPGAAGQETVSHAPGEYRPR